MLTLVMLRNGLAAAGQLLVEDLHNLPGTVTTAASVGPFTTTIDLRDYLKVGDYIFFSGQAGTIYGIAAITSTSITLPTGNTYGGTTGAGQTMVKANFVYPDATPSPTISDGPGTGGATLGSTAVTGSGSDYNTRFTAGDAIHFGTDAKVYVIKTVTSATAMVLETNYEGTTATGKLYRKSNFTPIRTDGTPAGRYGAIAIGTSSTASAAGNTGLGAEITTNGGGRRSGGNVTTKLTSADSFVTSKSEWHTTFSFSGGFGLFELAVYNHPTAFRGIALLRQVYASVFTVIATDLLNLAINVAHSATATATGVAASIGLKEAAKLLMDPSTTLDTGNGWSANTGTRFDTIALGSGLGGSTTAPALTQVALQTEITAANGFNRHTGDTSPEVLGTIMRDPDSSNTFPFTFTTDLSTSFAGDTVQWRSVFTSTATQTVREQSVHNGSTVGDGDPAAGSRMLIRQVYAADLLCIATDVVLPVIRLQQT